MRNDVVERRRREKRGRLLKWKLRVVLISDEP